MMRKCHLYWISNLCYTDGLLFLGPAVNQLIYWNSKLDDTCEGKKKGCPRTLTSIEEFSCTSKTQTGASRARSCKPIWVVLCNDFQNIYHMDYFYVFKTERYSLWPPRDVVQANMPKCF